MERSKATKIQGVIECGGIRNRIITIEREQKD